MIPSTSKPLSNPTPSSSNSSTGTLQLVIQNFRHMADTVRGPSKVVQSVPWRIMVMPRQHVVQKKAQGYIKDDKVVLEVSVKADPPKNILSLQEFTKKIRDYKRLADMQCQRGFIDKAIEVNTQALKFCKDKNDKCKAELESQKTYLIEMKLKQSIERIEKAANQSALRHALGTSAARVNNSTKNGTPIQSNKSTQKTKDTSNNDVIKTITPITTPPVTVRSCTPNEGSDMTVPPPPHKDNNSSNEFSVIQDNLDMQNHGTHINLSTMCSAGEYCRGQLINKSLVSKGQFNQELLKSDNLEYVKSKYQEEENLLPDQIHTYLQHLSEKGKGTARLKRFSNELEMLTSLGQQDSIFNNLAFENNENVNYQQLQALQNEVMVNIPPPALPARQRKKATAKKTNNIHQLLQQQQNQALQQQQQQHLAAAAAVQKPQLQAHLQQQQQQLSQQLLLQQPQIPEHNARLDELEARIKELEERERKTKSILDAAKSNETILSKQFYDAQKNLQQSNEKLEKLNQQLKDRKMEIKKLEKKAKSEAQLSTENSELHEKLETLKKENANLQKQVLEEQAKYKRDTQSLADSKKHLHLELNTRATEIQKLNNQLEEKTQALKKSEKERKTSSTTISNLTERLKKAEISLLEHKLEDGLKILERARDDCVMQMRTLEELQKRYSNPAEIEIIKKNINEWENKREEVVALINQTKTEFNGHITIMSGKQYSQLPKIQVPKPPPCPKLHPMPKTSFSSSLVFSIQQQQSTRINDMLHPVSSIPPIGVRPANFQNAW